MPRQIAVLLTNTDTSAFAQRYPNDAEKVIAKLNAALNASVATPEMREDLRKRGFVAMGGTPEELAKFQAAETQKWGKVIKAAGIEPE